MTTHLKQTLMGRSGKEEKEESPLVKGAVVLVICKHGECYR